jgi:hypothetical protein
MAEEKKSELAQVLDELKELKTGQQALVTDVGSIKKKQQEDGVKLEKLGSDIKAVADGHSVIRSEMKQGFDEAKKQVGLVDSKLDATARASYGLLTDVRKDVKDVKSNQEEHVRVLHPA